MSQYSISKGKNSILVRVKNNVYFISEDYQSVCKTELITNSLKNSIVAYKNDNNLYYYLLCYEDNNQIIILENYFDSNNCDHQKLKTISNNTTTTDRFILGNFLICNLMYNNILACLSDYYPNQLSVDCRDIKNNYQQIEIQNSVKACSDSVINMRSALSKERKKSLVCFLLNSGDYVFCLILDIINLILSDVINALPTKANTDFNLLVDYNNIKNEYIVLTSHSSIILHILILSSKFEIILENQKNKKCYIQKSLNSVYYLYGYNIFYSTNEEQYYIYYSGINITDHFLKEEITTKCEDSNHTLENIDFNLTDIIEEEKNNEYNDNENNGENEKGNNDCENEINFCEKNNDMFIFPKNPNEDRIFQLETDEVLENLINKLDKIIENKIKIGENYEILGKNYEVRISPTNSQITKNDTNIDFSACENILRKENQLPQQEILTLVQIEINKKNEKNLNWQIEYEIYDSQKNKLNLNKCQNTTIDVNYKIKNIAY